MDYIAQVIGISPSVAWGIFGAAIIAIIVGIVIRYFGRFLLIGAALVVGLAFLHEHASFNLPAPAAEAATPAKIVKILPVSDPQPAGDQIATPRLSDDESAFLSKCAAEGENSPKDCVQLYAEKLYVDGESAEYDDSASNTKPAPAPDAHAEYMAACKARGVPSYTCEVYFKRAHYND